MDQTTFKEETIASRVRRSIAVGRAPLDHKGNLLTLVLSALLVMVMAFFAFFLMGLASFVLTSLTELPVWLTNTISISLASLVALLVVMPMIVGRVRLSHLMLKGETPLVKDTMYYFTTPRRYARAFLTGLLYALCLAICVGIVVAASKGTSLLYEEVLNEFFVPVAANLLVAVAYHLVVIIAALLWLVSGLWLSCTFLAVRDESLSVFCAFGKGIRLGAKRFGCFFLYLWQMLLRFLVSLPTIGVLWLLYFGNLALTSFAALVTDLEK